MDPPSIACVFAPVYKTLLPTTTFLMCTTYLSRRSCPSMHPPKNSKQDISERGHSIKGNTYIICGLFYTKLEMWANAQPDGRPAEYRWRPLLNAANWLTPTTRVSCSNAVKTRNPLKFGGVPQARRQISAASRP